MPSPQNIEQWVNTSENQNYQLIAARYGVDVASANVEVKRSGHFPIVNANAGYQGTDDTNYAGFGKAYHRYDYVGVNVAVPLFAGGGVNAATRQAKDLYSQAQYQVEYTLRLVESNTRKSYHNIVAGISKIKADQQAITSRKTSLSATTASYDVGTRTILDVLNVQSDLYNAEKDYFVDQYDYLLNILQLKQAAGILSEVDVQKMNSWLNKKIAVYKAIEGK